jgi:signal transduction histidine kinase
MEIRRAVDDDRRETDARLQEERAKTDELLEAEAPRRIDKVVEEQLRDVREDVDAHLERQAEVLPKLADTLEEVADSLTGAAGSLTGVASSLKNSTADAPRPAVDAVTKIEHAADGVAVADEPAALIEAVADIAKSVADVATDLDSERHAADRKLRKERRLTDRILNQQIVQTESTVTEGIESNRSLLTEERQATDNELATERRHTDEAMDRVMEMLGHEQAALGAARKESASRNDFLAVVSHDLRGPLASMALAAKLIMKSAPEDDEGAHIREWAERITRSGAIMERLIQDLLDFASVEDGKLRVTATPHDIGDLLNTAVDVFQPAARTKSITIDVRVPDAPVMAMYDPGRMLQVISNLLQNAIKFTSHGGSVTVRAGESGRECVIAIADTGEGIPPEEMPFIFERFKQLRGDRGGLGLGLYISKWIVEAHGGRIWAESRAGQGSTFYVTLPSE